MGPGTRGGIFPAGTAQSALLQWPLVGWTESVGWLEAMRKTEPKRRRGPRTVFIEVHIDVFAKTGGVVVTDGLGIAKGWRPAKSRRRLRAGGGGGGGGGRREEWEEVEPEPASKFA